MAQKHFNSTFNTGKNGSLNACVGNNGWTDLNTYRIGFDDAVTALAGAVQDSKVNVDTIIYPLVFSARHSIELFLKMAIKLIGEARSELKVTNEKLVKTHDLQNLWALFKDNATQCDRRLVEFVKDSEETILDFSAIDPTGETYRYPYSQNKDKHLEEISVINVEVFYTRYQQLSKNIKYVTYVLNELVDEYQQGIFTKKLSRKDIDDISTMLPNRSEWRTATFNEVKSEVILMYGLSNRNFSEVMDIIQSHHEFSSNIGVQIPVNHITSQKLDTFLREWKIINELPLEVYNETIFDSESHRAELRFSDLMNNEYTHEEVADLSTLLEMGRHTYYSEDYHLLLKQFLRQDKSEQIEHFVEITTVFIYLNRSLPLLRQTDLISVLEKYI